MMNRRSVLSGFFGSLVTLVGVAVPAPVAAALSPAIPMRKRLRMVFFRRFAMCPTLNRWQAWGLSNVAACRFEEHLDFPIQELSQESLDIIWNPSMRGGFTQLTVMDQRIFRDLGVEIPDHCLTVYVPDLKIHETMAQALAEAEEHQERDGFVGATDGADQCYGAPHQPGDPKFVMLGDGRVVVEERATFRTADLKLRRSIRLAVKNQGRW